MFTALNQSKVIQNNWEDESEYYYDESETEEDVFVEEDSLYYYEDSIQIEETE